MLSDRIFSDIFQRCYYATIVLLWLYLWRNDIFCCWNSVAFLGIKNWYIIYIPLILMLFQIVFNNKMVWIFLFGAVIFFSAYKIYTLILWELIAMEREYIISTSFRKELLLKYAVIILLLGLLTLFFYKLKPHRNKVSEH